MPDIMHLIKSSGTPGQVYLAWRAEERSELVSPRRRSRVLNRRDRRVPDEQTYVLVTHADWKAPVEFMHHCSTKWAKFLLSLRDLVAKAEGRPLPYDINIAVSG